MQGYPGFRQQELFYCTPAQSRTTSSSSKHAIESAVEYIRSRNGNRCLTLVLPRTWTRTNIQGANFIHGTHGNPLTEIAEEVGATFAYYSSLTYYDGNGDALTSETSTLLYRKVWEYFKAASDFSRGNNVDKNRSLDEFFQSRLQEDQELEDNELRHLLRRAIQLLAGFSGCELEKLSLKYCWAEDELPVGI